MSTINEHVALCVREHADRVAVRASEQTLTYRELDHAANGVAHRLVRAGVRPGDIVGVHMGRSAAAIAALLGILRAGAAYLALDRRYPAERIRFMLADAGVRLVLVDQETRSDLPSDVEVLLADEIDGCADGPDRAVHPEDVAYVAYTSGSTGTPKGALIPHRAVVRLVIGADFLNPRPDDVVLHFAPIAFDASTFEIWGPLTAGGSVAVAPDEELSVAGLTGLVRDVGVTVMFVTTALFHQIVDTGLADLTGLRCLLTGGEVISPARMDTAVAALADTAVIACYGPTENTTFTTTHPITTPLGSTPVPIGRAIRGSTVAVLDEAGDPAETGELCTGGAGVAHGYLGRPALTADRFVPDPLGEPGSRRYRSGDVVRCGADGVLDFVGRRDDQVKIRGFRVELGDVGTALAAVPGVGDHVVLVRDTASGARSLHAVLVPEPGTPELPVLRVRRALAEVLPSYAVPSRLSVVAELPLTANGKVDRAALAARLDGTRPAMLSEYREPGTDLERVVADLWSDHLGIAGIGADDDFFELGGDSLVGVRIIAELHGEYGVEVSPRDFYLDPTPAGMATALAAASVVPA